MIEDFSIEYTRNNKFWDLYNRLSNYCKYINEHYMYHYILTINIIFAGVNIGLESYNFMNNVCQYFNILISIIFSLEIILKIIAETPYVYLFGSKWRWNLIDILIIISLFKPSFSLFRLFRVFRLFKMIQVIPSFKIIIDGLLGGVIFMGYIFLCIMIIFYVYAVFGFFMFGDSDPIHFGSLLNSMVTMFQIVTLDSW